MQKLPPIRSNFIDFECLKEDKTPCRTWKDITVIVQVQFGEKCVKMNSNVHCRPFVYIAISLSLITAMSSRFGAEKPTGDDTVESFASRLYSLFGIAKNEIEAKTREHLIKTKIQTYQKSKVLRLVMNEFDQDGTLKEFLAQFGAAQLLDVDDETPKFKSSDPLANNYCLRKHLNMECYLLEPLHLHDLTKMKPSEYAHFRAAYFATFREPDYPELRPNADGPANPHDTRPSD